MSENTNQATIQISSVGAGLEIKQKYSNKDPFSMTARFNLLGVKKANPDILDLMHLMSKKESELFIKIKLNMNYRTNTAVLDFGEISLSQRNHISNNLSTLVKMNLVKRITGIGKNVFMINPKYIIPPDEYLKNIQECWIKR